MADKTSGDGWRTDEAVAAALLRLVQATLRELHAGTPGMPAAMLDSVLDRDLGLDSLTRVELLLRAEREFAIELPEDTLQRTDTVADLLRAVQDALALPGRPAVAHRAVNAVESAAIDAAPDRHSASGEAPTSRLDAAETLLDVLDWHLQAHPDRRQLTCLTGDSVSTFSYRQLADAADAVAAGLQRAGVLARQTVVIMLPTSPEYFATYLGILRAGAVPVPIYPPARASQLEEHVLRHTGIIDNAQARLLVTVPEAMVVARLLQARVPCLRQVSTAAELSVGASTPTPVAVHGDDIAFIQYTSGSTGNPKGVALTHANLLANIRAMAQAIQATPDDVFVSWLPLYHDMGLIGAWLGGLLVGFPLVVMSPLAFLARPRRWLEAISEHRGTLSAAPNFAYELCLRQISDDELAGLDLRSWRLAFNGAEAVGPDTLQRFSQRFAVCGLRPETLAPVYGLAEACVGLLFPPLGRVAPVDRVQREPFSRQRLALPAAVDDTSALRFVACGGPLAGHAIRIVSERGQELGERVEGRLEFNGPSATHGYYRNPAQTASLIHDGWLDTGDRAYRAGGDVYITGRVKDIIIRGGRNLHPQEIEEAVGAVAGVRKGCVAVFGSADATSGTERLVVLAEVRDPAASAALREAVAQAVFHTIGEPPDQVLLLPPHSVLKTSSGKIRRSACRERFEAGHLSDAPGSARRQLLRLALGSAALRLQQLAAAVGRGLYGLHACLVFGLLAPLTWLLTALMPGPQSAWALARGASRLLFGLSATPLAVQGLEHLPTGPCVLVSNHGSYLDGAILVAALPHRFSFVAKRELLDHWVPRIYLRRMGAEFVERFDTQRSARDADRLADAVTHGRSLAFFPEGTFTASPGLLPFHLGAFLAAVRAGVPVLPVALIGHRDLLPDGRWWPRRAHLVVVIGAPLMAEPGAADAFAAAVRLRNAARRVIAQRLESH